MNMSNTNELLVSARDAEALAPLVGDRRRTGRFEADAADALAEVLLSARMVPYDRLPADRVAINSRVTYREVPHGEPRSVILVHPRDANATEGRISVLSPVGRALLGRKPGAISSTGVPGGRAVTISVLAAEQSAEAPSRSMAEVL
jgi:regulator of nucleoside diphosphate kinase